MLPISARLGDLEISMIFLIQISDLHFGAKLINQTSGIIPHQRPHNLAKCLALPSGINLARNSRSINMPADASLHVIVSGDLSVAGTEQQLAIANAFIRSKISISRLGGLYGVMGLNIPGDLLGVVPGNHDHWGGNRAALCQYNYNIFDKYFRFTPWAKTWTSCDDNFQLDVFGVDSNSGLCSTNNRYFKGVLAKGCISNTEFTELERKLKVSYARKAPTVRAIICHHSIHYQGGLAGAMELEDSSRSKLLRLSAKYHVAAILTGHTHDSHKRIYQHSDQNGNIWETRELRCASTLSWSENSREEKESGFLFHRITRSSANCACWQWDTWRFGWTGAGFICDKQAPWSSLDGVF